MAEEKERKETGKKNISIHPNKRDRKRLEKRKQNWLRNKSIRAQLYSSHRSSSWNQQVSTWHETLKALSSGSA